MLYARIGLLLLCSTVAAHAAESGWVLDYSPPEAIPSVTKVGSGQLQTLSLGSALQPGDVVRVVAGGSVRLGFADGTERELSGPGRWEMPQSRSTPTFLRVMQGVLGLVEKQGTMASSAATRDADCQSTSQIPSPPTMPGLQRVAAGLQTLPVGWADGCPPFELELTRGSTRIAHIPETKMRMHLFENLRLAEGNYTLRLKDGLGRETTVALMALPRRPTPPQDLLVPSSTLTAASTAQWFCEVEDGSWRLEGVKELLPLVKKDDPFATRLAGQLLSQP